MRFQNAYLPLGACWSSPFVRVKLVATHNPFAVNDVWFCQQTGYAASRMNVYGCILIDEENDEATLRQAAAWAGSNPVDIAELLDWVQRYSAAKQRKARAQVVLRAALKLPLVPGPVCRPTPN